LENKGHAYYFAVAARLSNFCHGFSNPLDTFSGKSFENRVEMAAECKEKPALLYFVMAA